MGFSGVWTMLATPMLDDGSIALDKFEAYIDNQVAHGITGVMALGSTGEFYALEKEERQAVLKEIAQHSEGRLEMSAGANAGSTRAVIENAKMAEDAGYGSILLAPPFYSNPPQDHLREHFEAVAAAVDIDIVLYDNPAQAGVPISIELLEQLAPNPQFVATKEASQNLLRVFEIKDRLGDRYQIISGVDDISLDMMFWGTKCWMSGPSNFLAAEFVSIYDAAVAEDWTKARNEMARVLPLVSEIESGKYLAKVKYCARKVGLDVGKTRGPVFDVTVEEAAKLDRLLGAIKAA